MRTTPHHTEQHGIPVAKRDEKDIFLFFFFFGELFPPSLSLPRPGT